MAEDPPRQPVVLRIKVRYSTADAFVERFAPYVARAGLFLRSKQPKPVGTEVRFELRLSDEAPVLVGMGVVRWAREVDPAKPYTPPGMAIEFTRVTKESRGVILKMLELRRALGMTDGPRGLPNPPDDDVAVVAAATASAVAAESGPVMTTGPTMAVIAAETAPVQAITATETAPVIAPPQWNGPAAPAQLEPLAARPRRPAASELVASMGASTGSLVTLGDAFGDLDAEEADVPGILARARAMVGHDLDGELATLLDQDAAPVAISIDEASAGLASLFGTAPVSRRNRRAADDSVPVPSRPSFAAPPAVAVAAAAAAITADLFAPVAPQPADTAVETRTASEADAEDPPMRTVAAPMDAEAELRAAEAEAEAAAAIAGLSAGEDLPLDPERTRVVKLDGLAALTAAPPEGATRVVSLDALAAASAVRDSDERTAVGLRPEAPGPDDERTRVVQLRPRTVDDGARTKIVHARELEQAANELDETLDFDRPRSGVPRDFADEPERETSVRMRPLPPDGAGPTKRPAAGRPTRSAPRTSPPPPPGRRAPPDAGSARRAASPAQAPLDDDSHDDDVTPPPVDPGDAPTSSIDLRAPREPTPVPARLPRAESSGSFELDDLVAELSAEAAVPVRMDRSASLDGLGRSLAGDALDADGIMADLDDLGRRRAPEGPFPDLASFADPPSAIPRHRADRADSLDAALAALDAADEDGDASEERTRARPSSHPGARPASDDDDDDSLDIEIELDDDAT